MKSNYSQFTKDLFEITNSDGINIGDKIPVFVDRKGSVKQNKYQDIFLHYLDDKVMDIDRNHTIMNIELDEIVHDCKQMFMTDYDTEMWIIKFKEDNDLSFHGKKLLKEIHNVFEGSKDQNTLAFCYVGRV